MKIAIMGTRGIPARYGGFETLAQELASRLADKGHDVVIYCRSRYNSQNRKEYKGVRLVTLGTFYAKYFETVLHTFLSVLHNIIFERTETVLLCNSANSVFIPLLRVFGRKVIINVDGLEWKRRKWNVFGRLWYHLGERLAVLFAGTIITDSRVIEKYYKDNLGRETRFIAYGADIIYPGSDREALDRYGLKKDKYALYVARLEPENNALSVIKAFNGLKSDLKLAVVGDAPYSCEYKDRLRENAGANVIFCGAVYGKDYTEILANSYFCVNATEVGGTHPAIVEAMGAGKCVLTNDVPENLETIGDAGIPFSIGAEDSLLQRMKEMICNPVLIREIGEKARERVRREYNWDAITDRYLEVM